MKDIDYRGVVLLEEWARVLADIFDNADEAIRSGDPAEMILVQDQLRTYVKRSPAKCNYLDEIAQDLSRELYESVADAKLATIAEHNRRLGSAIAMVETATGENRATRDALAATELRDRLADVSHLADAVSGRLTPEAVAELLGELDSLRERLS